MPAASAAAPAQPAPSKGSKSAAQQQAGGAGQAGGKQQLQQQQAQHAQQQQAAAAAAAAAAVQLNTAAYAAMPTAAMIQQQLLARHLAQPGSHLPLNRLTAQQSQQVMASYQQGSQQRPQQAQQALHPAALMGAAGYPPAAAMQVRQLCFSWQRSHPALGSKYQLAFARPALNAYCHYGPASMATCAQG